MVIRKPVTVRVGKSSVRVFGSKENHDFWTKTRSLKPSDLTPKDLQALNNAKNDCFPRTSHSHPVSDKKIKKKFDLRKIIRRIFTKREK